MIPAAFFWFLAVWSASSWEQCPMPGCHLALSKMNRTRSIQGFIPSYTLAKVFAIFPGSVTGSADSAHWSHTVQSFCWAGYSPSHKRGAAHFYLNYMLVLKLNFNPLPYCSGLEPQQCHSTGWNTSSASSPKPLLRIPTTGPPHSYQGKIASRIVELYSRICFILVLSRENPWMFLHMPPAAGGHSGRSCPQFFPELPPGQRVRGCRVLLPGSVNHVPA